MKKEILKMLTNKLMIQLETKNGEYILHSPFKVSPTEIKVLKAKKELIVEYLKNQEKIDEVKRLVAFLASFLNTLEALETEKADLMAKWLDDDSKKYKEILKTIEEHKKLYPEDSARAKVYKYIFDKAMRMAKHYSDLYFTTIGDTYIDKIIVAPVNELSTIKEDFNSAINDYQRYKHDDYPDK